MVDKGSYMTISEMAKQRNVTTETLRHYDRIGLFKPKYTDPDTGYRYYSIDQYETLGTIKELHQLGMSLSDIKEYFQNRTVDKSAELLKKQCEILKDDIKEKTLLVKTIEAKLQFLGEITKLPRQGEVFIRNIPQRYVLCFREWELDSRNRARAIMRLEELIRKDSVAPIVASNRIGACSNENFFDIEDKFPVAPMVLCDEYISDLECCHEIPAGDFVCMYYNGRFGNYVDLFEKVKNFINEGGYEICGMIYQIYQVDITITSDFSEAVIELQIPVKK